MIEIFRNDDLKKLQQIPEEEFTMENFVPSNCWINLVNPSDKEVAFISKMTNVEDDVFKAALDEEERSRIEVEDDYALVLVDSPILEQENDYYSYTTIPVGIVAKTDVIVTVCLKDTAILRDFTRGRVKSFTCNKRTRFLFQILYNIAAKFLAYLKQIDKASQRIQKELHKSTRNKELIQMLDLENSLVYFSTSLTGNDSVIGRILQAKGHFLDFYKMYEDDEDLLDDVVVETKQAMEMCNIYKDILSGTMDAYASVISNNLNVVMKVLTSITLVISIPTLIASFFGMNTGVPWEGQKYGFWIVIAISIMIAIIISIVLKKKKLL